MRAERGPSRRGVRAQILRVHRWLSLGLVGFWLVQAITGMLIVYHWEIEDAAASSLHRPTNFAALERRIVTLAPPGGDVRPSSLWISAGMPDRYKLSLTGPGESGTSVRLAGDGTVLERRPADSRGPMDTLVLLHQQLLAGETGEWIVGFSGIFLLSNLTMGFSVAWPRAAWRSAFIPIRKGPASARSYSWHRAIGLWAVVPAIVLVSAGTLLRFEEGTAALVGAKAPDMPARTPRPGHRQIGFAHAVAAAQKAIPGSTFTAATWPTAEDATWRFRMREPGEIRRAYGTSLVQVDADTGAVLAAFRASELPGAKRFMNALYAVHTGELGGTFGRVLVLVLGAWLATMIIIGLQLWWRRRARRV